jgi:hypothetical protein
VVAAAAKNSVVLENVHSVGNAFGIAVAAGNIVVINRSVMSESGIAGVEVDPGAYVYVDNTEISHNASYGIYALGTVGLANSDIAFSTYRFPERPCRTETTGCSRTDRAPRRRPSAPPRPISLSNNNR